MNQPLSIHRLQPFGASNSSGYDAAVNRVANRFLAKVRRPDLIAVIGFCAIGLILTFAALAVLSDFAAAASQIGAMP